MIKIDSNISYFSIKWNFIFTTQKHYLNYTFIFYLPSNDEIKFLVNNLDIQVLKTSSVTQADCFSNLNCKQIIFSSMLISRTYTEMMITFNHYKGPSYIFHQFTVSDNTKIINNLNSTNSLSLTQLAQEPYFINIFAI